MRARITVSVLILILAGCGGVHRQASPVQAVQRWHSACGSFSQDDAVLHSLGGAFRLDPESPSETRSAVSRVRSDMEALKLFLTHDERIGLGRYGTGVDSVERGVNAYLAGDLRGARQNFTSGVADIDASGLPPVCAAH